MSDTQHSARRVITYAWKYIESRSAVLCRSASAFFDKLLRTFAHLCSLRADWSYIKNISKSYGKTRRDVL